MPRIIGSTSTHSALPDVSIDQHHTRDHAFNAAVHTGGILHASLTDVTTGQHHAQAHTATDHSGGNSSSSASADATITVANTYVDGPGVSLVAGTYLVVGHIDFSMLVAASFYGRITDGATHYASGEQRPGSSACSMALAAIITLASTTTIKLQGTADAGTTNLIKAATTANGSGNNATGIRAYRLF